MAKVAKDTVGFRLPRQQHAMLKYISVTTGESMSDMATAAIRDYLLNEKEVPEELYQEAKRAADRKLRFD